jgi:hypothetical protein
MEKIYLNGKEVKIGSVLHADDGFLTMTVRGICILSDTLCVDIQDTQDSFAILDQSHLECLRANVPDTTIGPECIGTTVLPIQGFLDMLGWAD